jgi:hypothetical protein
MKRGLIAVVSRALVLTGLVVLNTVLPAEGFEDGCYMCLQLQGQPPLCLPGATEGHSYCEEHDDHCDMVGPCTLG